MKSKLDKLLDLCTPDQVKFFHRLYGPVGEMARLKVNQAIQLCERTIQKNEYKTKQLEVQSFLKELRQL